MSEELLNGRDIYEVANQLDGYSDIETPPELAEFLRREAIAATDLANEVRRLRLALIDHLEADGMVLVPREPTEAMIRALDKGLHEKFPNARSMALAAWSAMLSALPVLGVGR